MELRWLASGKAQNRNPSQNLQPYFFAIEQLFPAWYGLFPYGLYRNEKKVGPWLREFPLVSRNLGSALLRILK